MRSFILSMVFVFSTMLIFSQSENSIKNYKKGIKALDKKDYPLAISYLTFSIDQNPTAKAFLSRSEAYYAIGDSCAFCNDLKKGSDLNSHEAYKKFKDKCRYTQTAKTIPDSIKANHPNVIRIEITYSKCSPDSTINAVSLNQDEEMWINEISEIEDVPIYTLVENMPQYVGGDIARNQFLVNNIIYPEYETLKGIGGTVYISFVIDIDGSVTRVKLLRGVSKGIDAEAIRVVKLLPKWIPGTQNGKPVRVLFNMPFYFKMKRWNL